ncbi:MAG TPA: hypothetical protein VMT21_05400 [Gemmatimonadales bacterium]|nr:hypothetical protein [Gemmatimonadales bacterium]
MVDWTGVIAIVGFFGTVITGFVAFSPIGRAIGTHILRKSAAQGIPPEVSEQVDALAERLEGVQRQLAELAERQDFAERLLAKAREKGLTAGGTT